MSIQPAHAPETKVEYRRAIAEQLGCASERYISGLPRPVIAALHRELGGSDSEAKRVTDMRCEIAHEMGFPDPDRYQNKHLRFRKADLVTLYEWLAGDWR